MCRQRCWLRLWHLNRHASYTHPYLNHLFPAARRLVFHHQRRWLTCRARGTFQVNAIQQWLQMSRCRFMSFHSAARNESWIIRYDSYQKDEFDNMNCTIIWFIIHLIQNVKTELWVSQRIVVQMLVFISCVQISFNVFSVMISIPTYVYVTHLHNRLLLGRSQAMAVV